MLDRLDAGLDGVADALGALRVRHAGLTGGARLVDHDADLFRREGRVRRLVARRQDAAGRGELDEVGAGAEQLRARRARTSSGPSTTCSGHSGPPRTPVTAPDGIVESP